MDFSSKTFQKTLKNGGVKYGGRCITLSRVISRKITHFFEKIEVFLERR